MSNKITLLMLIIIIIADKYKTNFMFFSTSCHISFPSLMNCEEMNFFNAYCLAQKKEISFMLCMSTWESFIDVEKIDILFCSLKGE